MAEIGRCLSRYVARVFRQFRPLFDLTHCLTDNRAPKSQMLDKRLAPQGQLLLGVGGDVGQRSETDRVCHLHHFTEQRFLGPELAEDGDLVDPGRVGNAPGGTAAETELREHFVCSVDNFVSAVHAADITSVELEMQVVTCLHSRFHFFVSKGRGRFGKG